MSLWNDITHGIAQAAESAANSTEKYSNIAKLKYSVHTENEKLKECFEAIGKLCYGSWRGGDDNTKEIEALVSKADNIKANIKKAEAALRELSDTRVCDACGTKLDKGMAFCPSCGAKQTEKNDADNTADSDGNDETVTDDSVQ